ncbi:MAG: PmoA family protein [Terriglobia bacterium]
MATIRCIGLWITVAAALSFSVPGQVLLPHAKPIPHLQAVPMPYYQVSFQRDEKEIARYYFDPRFNRPFIFPVIGPSGRTLTRMGHPGDPDTHSHHNSIWIAYGNVNGIDFWSDLPGPNHGRIIHRRIVDLEDSDSRAGATTQADWTTDGGTVLLHEARETWVYALPKDEWLLILDLTLDPAVDSVTFDRAGFGPMSVRVAKSIAVHFGGGRLRNSERGEGEAEIFRKPARWVDYSGLVAPGIVEGLTLMDHPLNPGHPSPFHVREDGWMGGMLSTREPVVVRRGKPLHLRYGVYVHAGLPSTSDLDARWKEFTKLDLHPPSGPPKTESDCLHGGHRRFNVPQRFETAQACLEFVKSSI